MLNDARLKAILEDDDLELDTCAGLYSHVAQYRYASSLLSGDGFLFSPGRFHRQNGARALYFAESPLTALLEVDALFGEPDDFVVSKRRPLILLSVELVIPNGILDMTTRANQKRFGTENQELTGSWLLDPDPATQRLGHAAYECGAVIAIRYPSAKWKGRRIQPNLVVFRDRLAAAAGCKMIPYDPDGDLPPTVVSIRNRAKRAR